VKHYGKKSENPPAHALPLPGLASLPSRLVALSFHPSKAIQESLAKPPATMKNWLQSLLLFSPCAVWLLAIWLLGPDFALPNRLILAILCCAAGAGALLSNRRPPGLLSLAAGIMMLASVPFSHDLPLPSYDFQPQKGPISGIGLHSSEESKESLPEMHAAMP
jgi:hypothetical protein